ncbi:hypothetical protein C8R43DRAFT_1157174, partial [Mycena crocata]
MSPASMPPQTRLNTLLPSLNVAVTTLKLISDSLGTPFLAIISSTVSSLMTDVQSIKSNKDDCAQLLEKVYDLLCIVIDLHVKSDTPGELPPSMLYNLGNFTETLHKIHSFVEAQQEKKNIMQFFRQGEMNRLLKDCYSSIENAFEMFQATTMQQRAQKAQQKVLDLISALSDTDSLDQGSLFSGVGSGLNNRCWGNGKDKSGQECSSSPKDQSQI